MSSAVSAPDQHEFEQSEPDESPIGEYLSDIIRLPGYGELAGDCEEIHPIGFCEAGHVQFGGKDPCNTRTCPEHWGSWRKRAAASIVARLAAYRYLEGGPRDPARRLVHVVAAPPQEQRWTVSRFWAERSASKDPVDAVGGRGGVVIPHAYGVSDEGNAAWRDAVASGLDPSYGKWRLVRGHADDWEAIRPLVDVRPHTHQLVAARDVDGEAVEDVEAETGWVVNNVRSLKRFYVDASEALGALSRAERVDARRSGKPELEALEDAAEAKAREGYEDMARLSMYLLSHAAVQPEVGDLPRRNTVTYWGAIHAVDPEAELDRRTWEDIQKRAAAAVGLGELEESGEAGPARGCQRDECEAAVRPLSALPDRLADPDHSWFDSLGYDQQCELLGVAQWMDHKPPPGAGDGLPPGGFDRSPRKPAGVATPEDFAEWLRGLGRRRVDRLEVPLLTAGVNAP